MSKEEIIYNYNILNNIDETIITIDKDNKITNINNSGEKLLKTDKSNIIGYYISDFLDLKLYKYKIIENNIENNENNIENIKTYIIKSLKVNDIDEYDHNALMEKECFLFNVSHEIRTPLNGIIGMTQILKDKVDVNLQEYINIISTCGIQLMDILNDILDYAKITSGNISLVPSNFNLTNAVEEIHDIIIAKKNKSNIDITYSIDENIPENIFCDLKRLKQILINLISNGLKFTEAGSVKTTIKLVKRSGVKIYIDFIIEDTGIGIPSSYLEKIFQPYIQVNNQISRKYEGTGLGLTISRQLARLLGGDIKVKSKVGRGSTFTLTIEAVDPTPQINDQSHSLHNSFENESPNSPKYKDNDITCLVIDDNSNNRIMLYQLLSSLGIKSIIIVSSAEEAFLVINSYKFDIIFLDICMPKMDGIKTCIELKKKLSIIPPIIGMSSIDDSIYIIPNNLFNDLLLKPIKKSQLNKILDKYLYP
jgi:signal transduction histidine kinase/CheY-like chemotaxis protein